MSRGLPTAVANAVSADVVRPVLFVQCAFDSGNLNLWGGIGNLTAASVTYVGAGTLLSCKRHQKTSLNYQANGVTVAAIWCHRAAYSLKREMRITKDES
jgi:hypothetical protein